MNTKREARELENVAFLYPGLTAMWTVPARGRLRLASGRLTYSISDEPPPKVVKWVERSTGQADLAERLRNWTGPVEVLDVPLTDVKWKMSWAYSWTLLALRVRGVKWRIRFTPASGEIDSREVGAAKIGRRWRKALREAA